MSTPDPIDAYLDELAAEFAQREDRLRAALLGPRHTRIRRWAEGRRARRLPYSRFLDETRAHLLDAAVDRAARGANPRDARAAAVASFGPAGPIARQYVLVQGLRATRRVLGSVRIWAAAVGALVAGSSGYGLGHLAGLFPAPFPGPRATASPWIVAGISAYSLAVGVFLAVALWRAATAGRRRGGLLQQAQFQTEALSRVLRIAQATIVVSVPLLVARTFVPASPYAAVATRGEARWILFVVCAVVFVPVWRIIGWANDLVQRRLTAVDAWASTSGDNTLNWPQLGGE